MASPASRWSAIWLATRSLAWAVLLPGLFAGYLPWRFFGLAQLDLNFGNPVHLLGLLCIGLGAALLVACIWEFARSGRGTLAPIDPPRELVVRGLYRYVRNPMYLSVTTIVLGELLPDALARPAGVLGDLVRSGELVCDRVRGTDPASPIWGFLQAIQPNRRALDTTIPLWQIEHLSQRALPGVRPSGFRDIGSTA